MSHPYKTREGGATVTIFVPYDCKNHCPFCINKEEYADMTGFSLEKILESIRRTVASAGGQMSDVIKLVQYFRNLDHFPYYSRVRKLFYPDQPPVSTVVQVSEMLPDATVLIEVEATVWLPPSFNSEAPR